MAGAPAAAGPAAGSAAAPRPPPPGLDFSLVRICNLGQATLSGIVPFPRAVEPPPPPGGVPDAFAPGASARIAPTPELVAQIGQLLADVDCSYLCVARRD